MVGAGIFVVLGPAAAAAGTGLLAGLTVAAIVAYCNATSSHGSLRSTPVRRHLRVRTGTARTFWGYTAGWSFVVGKTASCAAMALTVGIYAWPSTHTPSRSPPWWR